MLAIEMFQGTGTESMLERCYQWAQCNHAPTPKVISSISNNRKDAIEENPCRRLEFGKSYRLDVDSPWTWLIIQVCQHDALF